MKLRYENEIRNAEKELYQLKHGDKDFDEQVVFTIQLLQNLPLYYDAADLITKQQIIGSIFLEKMIFENNSLRTKKINEAVALMCRTGGGLKGIIKKESSENSELSTLVPGTGFEPAYLTAPPPEDGASTNFATRAGKEFTVYVFTSSMNFRGLQI